ncbi:hypothetical protein J2S22_003231 [Rhodoplanes tepidamans]|nr:hypothetical protein [Rhodoplanes tepidamans]
MPAPRPKTKARPIVIRGAPHWIRTLNADGRRWPNKGASFSADRLVQVTLPIVCEPDRRPTIIVRL